jgi:hypothetical protein
LYHHQTRRRTRHKQGRAAYLLSALRIGNSPGSAQSGAAVGRRPPPGRGLVQEEGMDGARAKEGKGWGVGGGGVRQSVAVLTGVGVGLEASRFASAITL